MPPPVRAKAGNLPLELTSFVGRRREVTEVRRLLSVSRLVTLTGVGGVGKTRVALRVAADLRRLFDDEVWLVDLSTLQDPTLLGHTVAATLGLREQPARPPVVVLAEYLGGRQLLLVLDNCEHLVDACAVLSEALLRTCPDLRILATSREPLGIDGEATLHVPPLSVPDPERPPALRGLSRYGAVTLFTDRAAAVLPEFALTEDNQVAVVRICHRLDGLPLAIELAAARLRSLSADQILHRLTDPYRLLTSGSRSAPARQQTLRSCIEWSYDLCSAPERTLWPRLSVFAGGFELDAAEGICGGDLAPADLLDLVASLVGKSILIREGHGAVVRYRLLEPSASSAGSGCRRPASARRYIDGTGTGTSIWCCRPRPSGSAPGRWTGSPAWTGSTPTCAPRWSSASPSRVRPRAPCGSPRPCTCTGSPVRCSARAGTGSTAPWPTGPGRPRIGSEPCSPTACLPACRATSLPRRPGWRRDGSSLTSRGTRRRAH
jgi:predicted ATPase